MKRTRAPGTDDPSDASDAKASEASEGSDAPSAPDAPESSGAPDAPDAPESSGAPDASDGPHEPDALNLPDRDASQTPAPPPRRGGTGSVRRGARRAAAWPSGAAAFFRRSRRARLTAAGAAVVAVALALGTFVVAPVLIERAVQRYGDGVPGRSAGVGRVRVEPFRLIAVLDSLVLTDERSGSALEVGQVRLNFDFTTLFQRAVVLDELRIDSPLLRVRAPVGDAAASVPSLAAWLRAGVESRPLEIRQTALSQGRIEVTALEPGDARELVLDDISLRVSGFASTSSRPSGVEARLAVPSGGSVELDGELTLAPLAAGGRVAVEALDLAPLRPWLGPRGGSMQPEGVVDAAAEYAWTPERLTLSAVGAEVRELRVRDEQGRTLLESERLAVEGAALAPDEAGVYRMRADLLRLDGPRMDVAVNAREWRAEAPLDAIRHPFADVLAIGAAAGDAAVAVRRLEITGGRIDVEDRSVMPAARVSLEAAEGVVGFAGPGQDEVVVEVEGAVGGDGHGAVAIRFAGGAPRSVGLDLRGFAAATLSPYFETASGRALAAGTVDLDLDYRYRDQRHDGVARLTTQDLVLRDAEDAARPAPGAAEPPSAGPADAGAGAARSADGGDGAGDAQRENSVVRSAQLDEWSLAQALLQDADGRIVLTLPLDGAAGAAAALRGALEEAVLDVTAEPFDVLAALVDGEAASLRAVSFEPGVAEPRDAAAAKFAALAAALERRPRLGLLVAGRADPELDRDALATQQIELHVTLATAGPTLVARPTPVDFTSPRAWDVLDEFAAERLGAERLETVASYFERDTNGRVVEGDKPAYYRTLFDELVANESIPEAALIRLGRYRARAIVDALTRLGIAPERLETGRAVLVESVDTAGVGAGRDAAPERAGEAAGPDPLAPDDTAPGASADGRPALVDVPLELMPVPPAESAREAPPQRVASHADGDAP
ncbi:MAG: DUF748 domain-containing protein [Gammaproteobacteria bacterium]|nr:DUF748 domain-containing protein [Gammaproteobacteria bacterium]